MGLVENEFLKYLSKFEECSFDVELDKVNHHIGKDKPKFKVKFNKIPDIEAILESTSLALGEAYMEGELEIKGNIYEAFNIFLSQRDKFSLDKKALRKLLKPTKGKKISKRKTKYCYDLGIHFYELLLDETMSYNVGYFTEDEDTLLQAQTNNMNHIFDKLALKDGMSVCDISCGWGTMLIEAAKRNDITGVILTSGRVQEVEIKERVKREKLEKKIEVMNIDYRELPGLGRTFDCVVSIDNVETIGKNYYNRYFNIIEKILKEEGIFLLQTVSTVREGGVDPWIKKYIKPCGEVPSLHQIIKACSDSGMKLIDMENMRQHAARTYMHWNKNFHNNIEEIEEMYDRRFVRAWELYLNAYRASFNIGLLDDCQMIFTNGINNNLPLKRWF